MPGADYGATTTTGYTSSGRGGGAMDLSSIPGLVSRYDASVSGSIAQSGGRVTQLNDLFGPNHLTNAVASGPFIGGTTMNGVNTLGFYGGDHLKQVLASVSATNTMTTFIVMRPDGGPVNTRVMSFDIGVNDYDNTGSMGILRGVVGPPGRWGSYYNSAFRGDQALTDVGAGHVLTVIRNGDSNIIRVDGVAGTTVTGLGTTNFAMTRIWLGGDHTASYYTGQIGEVVFYNTALSAGNITTVEAYLKGKWGTP